MMILILKILFLIGSDLSLDQLERQLTASLPIGGHGMTPVCLFLGSAHGQGLVSKAHCSH